MRRTCHGGLVKLPDTCTLAGLDLMMFAQKGAESSEVQKSLTLSSPELIHFLT